MSLSSIAIKRPIFAAMFNLFLMVLGGMGLSRIGTDLFPDVSFPLVVINTTYRGASPGEVEQLVTKPIEDQVVSINGVDTMQSQSRESLSTVIMLFKLDVDVKQAALEVREKVALVRPNLPDDIDDPVVGRIDTSAAPIATYTLSGVGHSLSETQKFAKDNIKPALEQVEGVGSVNIKGGAEREIHVDLDLAKVAALHLTPAGVVSQLKLQNMNVPAGHFDEGRREISVRTLGEFTSVEDIRRAIVATRPDGSSVRLADVGTVEDDFEDLRTKVRVNGTSAVIFDVVKQSGTNTIAVADAVFAKLDKVKQTLPQGYSFELVIDQSKFIRENAHEVEIAIVFGGVMAILVILVFMLDLRSTLISAVALPTSVISSFFLMYVLGFTLNMMTLLALSLAIGLLIDDAVVVRENISKHLERGVPPMKAALDGTSEIALSVLATTLTIVAVFVPVSFMTGMVGQFFRQFGLTMTVSVLMSLFVAFTLDPMLSSRFSKAHVHGQKDPWEHWKAPFLRAFASMEDAYRSALAWCVKRPKTVVGVTVGIFFGSLVLVPVIGVDFVAAEDRGQFMVDIEFPAGTSLSETERASKEAELELLKDKDVKTVLATVGDMSQVNKVKWRVLTTSKQERDIGIIDLKNKAREVCAKLPNAKVNVTDPAFVEGAGTDVPIIVQVRGLEYDRLVPLANEYARAMKAVGGMSDIQVKYNPGAPELRVSVDRDKAAAAGVPVALVAASLRSGIEGEEASKLRQGKDEVPIRVRYGKRDRSTVDDVLHATIATPHGDVQLRDLASVERGEGPSVIERQDRERQIVIWAAPSAGSSMGEIQTGLNKAFAEIKNPPGYGYKLDGQIKRMNESNSAFGIALLLGVAFIYIVLASQFESLAHPLTIMVTLPLALIGALGGLFFAGKSLAMGSIIGVILLMGLVTKNAILLVDRALVRVREHGETPLQAVLEAGPERLRPIVMTSAAMILGMLPTAISNGDGSEFRSPMAIAVIGGVISSTFMSLLVIPVGYLMMERTLERLRKFFNWKPADMSELPAE